MQILERDGLSLDLLQQLSLPSGLGKSLKHNIADFDKDSLLQEAFSITKQLIAITLATDVSIDYRIKSMESVERKYDKYYPDRQAEKVFNDLISFGGADKILD